MMMRSVTRSFSLAQKPEVGHASEEMQKLSLSQQEIDDANKYKRM